MTETIKDRSILDTEALQTNLMECFHDNAAVEPAVFSLLKHTVIIHNAEFSLFIKKVDNKYLPLFSTTIDGHTVPEADEKIPRTLLQKAETENKQFFFPQQKDLSRDVKTAFTGLNRKGVLLYKVKETSTTSCYLYFENRFCPLETGKETIKETLCALTLMRLLLHLLHLNEKLEEKRRELSKAESLLSEIRQPELFTKGCRPQAKGPQNKTSKSFKGDYSDIITCSPRMYSIFSVIDRIAHTNAPVLIIGESGTGKELIAGAIHRNSPRSGHPFVSENCAALTETLLESELFGYVKGAFTGADTNRKGLFEIADKGSLFLDEVGDMSANMQKKLLRVLQENVIRKVGGKEFIPVNVRIISATNRNLSGDIDQMHFREDLFYRLNVITIELPPLRNRPEDISILVQHFLQKESQKDKTGKTISREAMDLLQSYSWPGNIRELQNEVQRMYALSGRSIRVDDLSEKVRLQSTASKPFSFDDFERLPLKEATESFEREFLRRALKKFYGNKSKVANELKVPKTSLYHKIKKYNLTV